MNAGHYRHRINFLHRIKEKNDYGELKKKWVVFKSGVWAAKDPLLGNEFFASLTTDNKVEVKFNMRFIPGITAAMRIQHGDNVYEILGEPVNVKSLNQELLCYCKKVVE